jgi:hypothetical protein
MDANRVASPKQVAEKKTRKCGYSKGCGALSGLDRLKFGPVPKWF